MQARSSLQAYLLSSRFVERSEAFEVALEEYHGLVSDANWATHHPRLGPDLEGGDEKPTKRACFLLTCDTYHPV